MRNLVLIYGIVKIAFLIFGQTTAPRGIAKTDYSDLDNSSLRARTSVQSPATNPTYVRPIHQTNGEQKMISPQDKQLLKTTWSMVAPISDVAAGLFYDRLFTLDPSLQRMFANADMKEQRRKLMQALAAVINGIDNLGALVPALENLGKNHVRYGVTDRHYDTVAPPCSGRWNRASRKHGRQRQSPPGPRPIPPSQP
jgi:Globin